MGIPTLIKTETASNSAAIAFVDGASSVVLDGTYDEYMFVFTDIGPATDGGVFEFQANAVGASGYNETMTTTFFNTTHWEDDAHTDLAYSTGTDQAQGTAFQGLSYGIGNGGDESLAGILHLFSPSNTTYVKHYYSRVSYYDEDDRAYDVFTAGYFNTTTAIDDIQFKMSSGNFDGVIQMYGIS